MLLEWAMLFFAYTFQALVWSIIIACVFSVAAIIGLYGMWVYYRLTGKDIA